MKRFHALEWEDLEWFPSSWRDYGTDYLKFIATKMDIYKSVLPIIKKGLAASGGQDWVDCASGGGGGLVALAKHLQPEYPQLKITMTDYFPNVKAFERVQHEGGAAFQFESTQINAMDMPAHLQGKFRTMFASFHHFRPADAQKILQNAVDTRSPIAIFEPVGRNFGSFFSIPFSFINALILTPFMRPVRWSVLPFIYLLPLVPLFIVWDGIASIFRIYSEAELRAMVSRLQNADSFDWEIGQTGSRPMPVYYLLGTPKR